MGFQAGVDDSEKSRKRKRAPFESEADEVMIDRWQRLRKIGISKQLKRMMGNEAEFRGVQKQAIKAIAAGESLPAEAKACCSCCQLCRAERQYCRRRAVNRVTRRHEAAMHEAEDFACQVREPPPAETPVARKDARNRQGRL